MERGEGKYIFEREMSAEDAAQIVYRIATAEPTVSVKTNELQAIVAGSAGETEAELAKRALQFKHRKQLKEEKE